jgi:hypothetical protein
VAIQEIEKNGICNFDFPEDAVEVIDSYYSWSKAKT